MPRLTWNPKNEHEIQDARTAFKIYERRRFVAKHKGKRVTEFDGNLGELTFEPMRTAYDRIMEDDDG